LVVRLPAAQRRTLIRVHRLRLLLRLTAMDGAGGKAAIIRAVTLSSR
jgi:hypothetical protein